MNEFYVIRDIFSYDNKYSTKFETNTLLKINKFIKI